MGFASVFASKSWIDGEIKGENRKIIEIIEISLMLPIF